MSDEYPCKCLREPVLVSGKEVSLIKAMGHEGQRVKKVK